MSRKKDTVTALFAIAVVVLFASDQMAAAIFKTDGYILTRSASAYDVLKDADADWRQWVGFKTTKSAGVDIDTYAPVVESTCPAGLYPNGSNCYPCLGCAPCPSAGYPDAYCATDMATVLPVGNLNPDAFINGYVYLSGRVVKTDKLDLRRGGVVIFQMYATNRETGEKMIPADMQRTEFTYMRGERVIGNARVDNNGRFKMTILPDNGRANADSIVLAGSQSSRASLGNTNFCFKTPPSAVTMASNLQVKSSMKKGVGAPAADYCVAPLVFIPARSADVNLRDIPASRLKKLTKADAGKTPDRKSVRSIKE